MKIETGIDDCLLECIARSGQPFEAVLLSGEGFKYLIRAVAYRVIPDYFEPFNGKTDFFQRILCDGSLDNYPNQREQNYYA